MEHVLDSSLPTCKSYHTGKPTGASFTTESGHLYYIQPGESPHNLPLQRPLNRLLVSTLDPYSLFLTQQPEQFLQNVSHNMLLLCSEKAHMICAWHLWYHLLQLLPTPLMPLAPGTLLLGAILLSACLTLSPLQVFAQQLPSRWRLFWWPFLKFQPDPPEFLKVFTLLCFFSFIVHSSPSNMPYNYLVFISVIYCLSPPSPH